MAFTIEIPGTIPTIEEFRQSAPIGISPIGTPVFDDVTFPAGSYITLEGKTVDYDKIKLDTAKILVNQTKNIVKTSVAGLDYTIKEYMSLGDYVVTINGKFTELFDIFPAEKMFAFKGLVNVPENIPVISKFLNEYFDIFNVVVTDFSAAPVIGSLNEVSVNMTLLSDKDTLLNNYVK